MKKTIVAVMVAASAVLSAQALAINTAEVTVLGEVNDSSTSCEVSPTGTLNSGIVRLITTTTSEANDQTPNTLFKEAEFGYDVANCAKGSTSTTVTGLNVSVFGTTNNTSKDILENIAENGAEGIGIGMAKFADNTRLNFDSTLMSESYKPGEVTHLRYKAGYVKLNSTTPVTEGAVKGVATFTIDYTTL